MANRDFIAKYGESAVNAMDERQRIEKLYNFISKYEDYFENRGIDGLKAVDMEDY
jgi:hypothetical protein